MGRVCCSDSVLKEAASHTITASGVECKRLVPCIEEDCHALTRLGCLGITKYDDRGNGITCILQAASTVRSNTKSPIRNHFYTIRYAIHRPEGDGCNGMERGDCSRPCSR